MDKGEDNLLGLLASLLSPAPSNSYARRLGNIPPNSGLSDQAMADTLKRLLTPSSNRTLGDQATVETLKRLLTSSPTGRALGDQATAEALRRLLPVKGLGDQAITAKAVIRLLKSQGGKKMAEVKRRVFYSFQYKPDNWRASQVRGIGAIEGNKPATDNEWEKITSPKDEATKDKAIKKWIADQMDGRTCTVVLVGKDTAGRKWINHEIVKSWDDGMGVVGIYVHGLKDSEGKAATKGDNPFDYITHGGTKKKLSSIVKCYNPGGDDSKERYAWIEKHLANAIEEAIKIRNEN